jgi:hypothetical protein
MLKPIPPGQVRLLPSLFTARAELNRRYLLSLREENLLQNYYLEAGLWSVPGEPENCHWGWESPTCQLRGHFLGHWLSAAARLYATRGDLEIKARADWIISELARCQAENGGEWAGSIPEKYFDWLARGKEVWAPHYTVHKTLMGLYEMATLGGSAQALEILVRWSAWFHRWSARFTRAEMDRILEVETGGMMELWADLSALTGRAEYLQLMERYERRLFFDPLLAGEDVLTDQHANTRIPEIHGAARAWEVTGEPRWREIVEAFWRCAVTDREAFCTGGGTDGEIWTPPGELAARLSSKNQEHCTVYNLMRLAEYLYRWTGDPTYADYWERNLYNGILAQQHPATGMVAYFLPLKAGSAKKWSTPTESFWCCLGTLVQAHTMYEGSIFYTDEDGLVVNQVIPAELDWSRDGVAVRAALDVVKPLTAPQQPRGLGLDTIKRFQRYPDLAFTLEVACESTLEFTLKIRIPWWIAGRPTIEISNQPLDIPASPSTFVSLRRVWSGVETVYVEFPKDLTTSSLPDAPEMAAFMDGPVVLAGLFDEERVLYGDKEQPETILAPVHELEWYRRRQGYRTRVQPHGTRFVPLYDIADERYTIYFPIQKPE